MTSAEAIAVFGAAGMVGRRICARLAASGAAVRAVGRRRDALADAVRGLAGVEIAVAALDEPGAGEALARAFAGVRAVINAAGPLRDTAARVLDAAIAEGAHYVDVGGEQDALRALYEARESAVRRAGLIALPGAGVDPLLGDLAAAWAAGALTGPGDAGDAVREAPAARLAEDLPIDDITVSYVLEHLALSPTSQRALFGALGDKPLVWRRDRWETGRPGERRRVAAGALGERDAVAYVGGAVITIPRHVAAQRVAAYVSIARRPGAAAALRAIAVALPLIPRRAAALLAPYAPPDADYAATEFAVIAEARRGAATARAIVRGRDLYATTAAIAAWSALRLVERSAGPLGLRAPGELFRAGPALRAIASAADLTIEPSFG